MNRKTTTIIGRAILMPGFASRQKFVFLAYHFFHAIILVKGGPSLVNDADEPVLRDFLVQDILYDKDLHGIDLDASLISSELLDSLGVMRIVAFIEDTWGILVPDDMLVLEHFESMRQMLSMIGQLRVAKGG
jgi:methoxymalonate biosynthesis acyl carrier protein